MSFDPRLHPGPRPFLTRREMLRQTSTGFGWLALTALMADRAYAGLAPRGGAGAQGEGGATPTDGPLAARAPDFAPRVRNVIFCYLSGGLSHVDSFDPKPRLAAEAGRPMPFETERTMFNQDGNIWPSPWAFTRYGESGIPVSALFPHIGSVADELTVIRSMTAPFMEHAQANFYFHCGMPFTGFPSMGAWITYGLGTENQNLPGFVVLGSGGIPLGGINVFGNGFLPAVHQGSLLYPEHAEPLHNVRPSEGDARQRARLAFIGDLDREFLRRTERETRVEAAIDNYETAYRMQTAVPELTDLAGETEATKRLYGLDSPNASTAAYGRQCLVARRLVERGVRFVELTMVGTDGMGQAANPWDQHTKLEEGHTANALTVDQPVAGLIRDLRSRGLLDETLVIFSGEFGRTPVRAGHQRTRPQPLRLQPLAGRRRSQEGLHPRPHRRVRLPRGRERPHRARPPRHGAAPPGPRPPGTHVPLRRPRLPSDRRRRASDPGRPGVVDRRTSTARTDRGPCRFYTPCADRTPRRPRIAAICVGHGVRELLTADRDFSRFPSLTTRNPLVA